MFGSPWIDAVEAAYRLDGDDHAWLEALAQATLPALDRGLGVVAYVGETRTMRPIDVATSGATEVVAALLRAIGEHAPGAPNETYLDHPVRVVSLSETTFFGDAMHRDQWETASRSCGLIDGLTLYAHSTAGKTVHLFAPSAAPERPHGRERRAWLNVAAHIAAGHRVRAQLGPAPGDEHGDAVLDPNGRVLDARGDAADPRARRALREAVIAMERARGPLRRRDGERALALWGGLVAGRWSLVDRWDSDGKRFIVAVENRPETADPRALRPREAAAARLASEGGAPKDIAYALDISPSNARAILASALAKLGLASRADLFRWNPAEAHVHEVLSDPRTEALVLDERPPQRWSAPAAGLTEAELDVARLAASGMTNGAIARARNVDPHGGQPDGPDPGQARRRLEGRHPPRASGRGRPAPLSVEDARPLRPRRPGARGARRSNLPRRARRGRSLRARGCARSLRGDAARRTRAPRP